MQPDRFGSSLSAQTREIDAGLRHHMNSIYARMTMGVLITALVAFALSMSPQALAVIFGTPLKWVVIFAPLAVVWFGFNPAKMSADGMRLSFITLSVLYGLSFGALFAVFTGESIAKAFFVSAGAFAGLSLYGYSTKKDLSGLGSFCVMGIMGALALGIVSMFLHSSMLVNMVSVISLVAFAGMTAWETQRMKEMYSPTTNPEIASRMGWLSALQLYISFIAMFQSILQLMGNRN